MTKSFETIEEAELFLKKEVNSCGTDTDLFMAKCFPLLLKALIKKKRKNTSKWNQFVSKGLKEGKSMKQIAEEWRK